MQGKESKHSALKQELKTETNRSTAEGDKSKWHQIMRASYVRDFYLPYHFPLNDYHSHYQSRVPPCSESEHICSCFRTLLDTQVTGPSCCICSDSMQICEDAVNGFLSDEILNVLLPIKCRLCTKRYSDFVQCHNHVTNFHNKGLCGASKIIPKTMTTSKLKEALKDRNLPVSGKKELLCRRLESVLANEMK